jgi:hypothetical protein
VTARLTDELQREYSRIEKMYREEAINTIQNETFSERLEKLGVEI